MSEQFEYTTTLNGAIVSVWFNVEVDEGTVRPTFDAIFYEGTDVTPILSKEQISELEMEAEKGFWESEWESTNL